MGILGMLEVVIVTFEIIEEIQPALGRLLQKNEQM